MEQTETWILEKDHCRTRVSVTASSTTERQGGRAVNEARRLRQLEEENGRLKKTLAQQALEIDALKVVMAKSDRPTGGAGCGASRAGTGRADQD